MGEPWSKGNTDVAPGAKEWAALNAEDSKTFIALGVEIADGDGWSAGYNESARYAADEGDTLFGSLDAAATGSMALKADYGLAFDQNYTAVHNLVFLFNLA